MPLRAGSRKWTAALWLAGLSGAATADPGGDTGGVAAVREELSKLANRVKILEIQEYKWKQKWATETAEWKNKWAEEVARRSESTSCDGLQAVTAQVDEFKSKIAHIDELKEKKRTMLQEQKEKFEDNMKIMKALQDHLFLKYQFAVLKPNTTDGI